MTPTTRPILSRRTLAIISALMAIPIVVLWVVDYRAGAALLAGLIVAWLIYAAAQWRHLDQALRRKALRAVGVGALVVVALAVVAIVVFLGSMALSPLEGGAGGGENAGVCPTELKVTEITVIVDGADLAADSVTISGQATGTPNVVYLFHDATTPAGCPPEGEGPAQTINLPRHTLTATQRGFMLREAAFDLFDILAGSPESFEGYRLNEATIHVELRDFPRGSFYQARSAPDVETSSYLDRETIKWTAPESAITFSYIPTGWGFTRPAVDLLYGAQTLDQLALGALGSIGSLILGTVVDVVVGRFVKKPLEGLLEKKGKTKKRA